MQNYAVTERLVLRRPRRSVTSTDVARAAGVSQSAVSRAFTPGASIAKETRDAIFAAARKLGYSPRPAMQLGGGRKLPAIAIVMSDVTNPFFPELLAAFSVRLRSRGFVAELHCAPPGVDIDALLPGLFRHKVAGVVVTSATWSQHVATTCRDRGLPVVLFNRSVPIADLSTVSCDNYAGGRQVAELLLRSGHERIAFIAGREDTTSSRDRERGLRDGLAAAGMEICAKEAGGYRYEGAFEATRRLLNRKPLPDAIFCANDVMALAAIDATMREGGLRVPEDVSIVGFDGISMSAWPAYRLTTVRQRTDIMIDETIELLERLAAKPDSAGISRLVTGVLEERGTTRAAPGAQPVPASPAPKSAAGRHRSSRAA